MKDKTFHIETFTGSAYLNFFTTAKSSKAALRNLLNNSWDYKNLVNKNADLTIKLKQLKK
jgi:hypothetical protein